MNMLVDDCRMKAKTFSGLRQIAFGDYGILDLGLIQGLGFMLAPFTPRSGVIPPLRGGKRR